MAWDKHHNKTYYYRKHRVNGRIITQYLGRSRTAALASLDANSQHAQRATERAAALAKIAEYDDLVTAVAEFDNIAKILTTATLLASGYHMHKRQWRKKRATTKRPKTTNPADTNPNPH